MTRQAEHHFAGCVFAQSSCVHDHVSDADGYIHFAERDGPRIMSPNMQKFNLCGRTVSPTSFILPRKANRPFGNGRYFVSAASPRLNLEWPTEPCLTLNSAPRLQSRQYHILKKCALKRRFDHRERGHVWLMYSFQPRN